MKLETIAIIAGGTVRDRAFHLEILAKANLIICADGGANSAVKLGVIPNYVIGDLDSIKYAALKKIQKARNSSVIYNPDQGKTDLELAIALAESFEPEEILILGAIGDNFDHTLANIICLDKIKRPIRARIIDEENDICLVDSSIDLKGKKGDLISVIPLTPVRGLSYDGLKWNVENIDVEFGWFGIRNRMAKSRARISLNSGKILVIKTRI
jgi:thiamine pyrophosphokinase